MDRKRMALIGGAAALALAGGGVGVTQALGGDEETEQTVTGPEAERVKAAAVKLVPGTAGSVERDSEKGATWEVEVRKPDGSTVDVRLGADLQKVAIDQDTEKQDDKD